MRNIVLKFGLISGALLSAMMAITIPFQDTIGFDLGMVVGYTTMVLAFLFVYFGVRSYRDTVAGGSLTFGRAFKVGALIALIASCCYVATWEVMYFKFMPDFAEKMTAQTIAKARAAGESPEAIAKKQQEMAEFEAMYQNPAINAAMTFLEPLPVALIMTLVSAGLLSRRSVPPRET
ncbi:DUF4199 domain-containing protein [Gemmatimonas sp.]|uniref:DUF4199 domain-containing protein n=1 Tax=Gemmatimonas sp. TaxID=1962908 RepID=UPI00286C90F8|nr:DUF4199 domain-containing protein [Gemmatimonas sp.]